MIGTLGEKSLHAALKAEIGRSGDQFEQKVDGFVIDIVRGETLIEIQTRNLGAMKRKLGKLLPHHPVHLVHPIAARRWIVRETAVGDWVDRRKSPKRGYATDAFRELVRIPHLLTHPNLTLELLLVTEEEVRRDDGQGSWRRKGWSIADRRLLEIMESVVLRETADFQAMLPENLPPQFTNADLATRIKGQSKKSLAQKMTYTLRKMEAIEQIGKQGRAHLYAVSQ